MIAIAAAVVRATGVLLLALSTICGQVIGSLALDLLTPTETRPGPTTYAGAALALVAAPWQLAPEE